MDKMPKSPLDWPSNRVLDVVCDPAAPAGRRQRSESEEKDREPAFSTLSPDESISRSNPTLAPFVSSALLQTLCVTNPRMYIIYTYTYMYIYISLMTVKSPLLRIACVRASRGGARLRIRYANIIDKIVRMDSIRPRAPFIFSPLPVERIPK